MFWSKPRANIVKVKGWVDIEVRRDGKIVDRRSLHNLVVDAGFNSIIRTNILQLKTDASHIDGAKYVAVGTGTVAAAAGDTALGAEITTGGLARAVGTYSEPATKQGRVAKTFSSTASFAVTEAGLLTASAAGTLLCRQTFAAVNVVSGDDLLIQWTITLS